MRSPTRSAAGSCCRGGDVTAPLAPPVTLSPAAYRALADTMVALHFGFVLFVVLGGMGVLRWRRAAGQNCWRWA